MGSAERMKAVGDGSAPLGDPPSRPLDRLSVGSGLPFFDPIDPNRLGVRLLPDVGLQGGVVRLASQQPIEDVLHVDEDVEVVAMRATDERHEIGSAVARRDTADEHPVFSAQGHLLHQLLGLVVVDRHQAVVEIDEQVLELIP